MIIWFNVTCKKSHQDSWLILKKVPIVIVSAEASYHSPYDHGTSNFLKQAGVKHDFFATSRIKI